MPAAKKTVAAKRVSAKSTVAKKTVAAKRVSAKAPAAKAPPKRTSSRAAATPKTKLKKTADAVMQVTNKYDAGGSGRRMRGWNPPSSGPNRAIVGLQNIRNRSRDANRNDWTGASGTQHWTTNLIGVGIVPRLRRITSKERKQALIDLWDRWVKECDADGVLNFYGLQTLFTRSWLESGEVFIRLRPRRPDSGLSVGLQVQLIEADFVPMLDADNWPDLPRGNRIRSGIELNRIGQRVAYWVYREHPGDDTGSLTSADAHRLVRVARSQMLHVFEPKRPGQLRGVPDFAPILARLRTVADYDDAVLTRQQIANLFALFVTRALGDGSDGTVDPLTGRPISTDAGDRAAISLEPGIVHELEAGEDVKMANPPEAGTMYHEYMRTQHLGTAAGQGLPYEIMSGDIKEVSDRTLRVIINEFRRYAEQRQWQIIIPQACQPIREAWVDQAALEGSVRLSEIDDAKMVEWAPHGWPYIHPVQDVQAKQTEVEARFRSRSSVISERGDDPETVDDEIAADMEREERLGIKPEPVQPQQGQGGDRADGDGISPGEYPRNKRIDAMAQSIERLHTQFEAFVAKQTEAQAAAHPQPAATQRKVVRDPSTGLITDTHVQLTE